MSDIYFTADLHIGHTNILRYADRSAWADYPDIGRHDEALIREGERTVQLGDTVYVLGDLTAYQGDRIGRLLDRLPGDKVLVVGNHDSRLETYHDRFVEVRELLELSFGREHLLGLPKDGRCDIVCCHYPMLTWHRRSKGAIMLHGHVHGTLDFHNRESRERRFDVGVDGELTRRYGVLKSLQDIYAAASRIKGEPKLKVDL